MRRLLVLVSSLLVASGCLGSQLAAPHLTTTGKTSSTATASSFCQRPMTLRGDVTGDGRPDRVTLSEQEVAADQACIPRLTIHVAGGAVITSRLSNVGHEPFSAIFLGLGPVDRRPGDEMLITLVCGTACFPGIFTVTDG